MIKPLLLAICTFIPPKDWELASRKDTAGPIQMMFIESDKTGFQPSLNLTTEKTSLPLENYLVCAQKRCQKSGKSRWRDLGSFTTQAGEARLVSFDTLSDWGEVRLLQLILLKEGYSYVLTAGALKKDFARLLPLFKSSFNSIVVTEDPLNLLENSPRKKALQEMLEQKKPKTVSSDEQNALQTLLRQQFSDMGAYWQLLIMDKKHA